MHTTYAKTTSAGIVRNLKRHRKNLHCADNLHFTFNLLCADTPPQIRKAHHLSSPSPSAHLNVRTGGKSKRLSHKSVLLSFPRKWESINPLWKWIPVCT